ncbi:MAG: RNA polymerase factor sigma-54, partial [Pseudomonadota bacterium]|nr:RNA polymerase factor sigma-54 [Pseudomonadota bacterium]
MIPPTLKHEHRQQQTLTPRLQHAVRLLQMSALDYEQELRDMMQRNPFLEVEEPSAPSRPEPSGDAASRVALDADAITSEAPGDASSDAP